MKRILIIGAGYLQAFVIKRAKELGYYTLAIDKNPKSVGFKYADEYEAVDIIDIEACLKYAKSKSINGVMTVATDYGVLSASYIAQEMGLPGLDYNVAKRIKNKHLVRRALFDNNVDDISQYYEIGSPDDLERIRDIIRFPVMVKPCDGSGSKAASRADNFEAMKASCEEAINASLIGRCLAEDFIEGKEYGAESFVYDGEVHVLSVMGKHMTPPPYYAELGHHIPSELSIEAQVKKVVSLAINALGINFGAVNMDLLISKENHICIIDVGARMGGNLIGSHIIPLGTGIDYMGNLIKASAGDGVNLNSQDSGKNVATRILALRPGKVKKLPDFEEIQRKYSVSIYHHLELGDTIREYHNNLDSCGYVVAIANSIEEAQECSEKAKNAIDNSVVRE